jgi:hypothetical protein
MNIDYWTKGLNILVSKLENSRKALELHEASGSKSYRIDARTARMSGCLEGVSVDCLKHIVSTTPESIQIRKEEIKRWTEKLNQQK